MMWMADPLLAKLRVAAVDASRQWLRRLQMPLCCCSFDGWMSSCGVLEMCPYSAPRWEKFR